MVSLDALDILFLFLYHFTSHPGSLSIEDKAITDLLTQFGSRGIYNQKP